jgi:hypothetical protein
MNLGKLPSAKRLRLVMKNIIDNKGTFKPKAA